MSAKWRCHIEIIIWPEQDNFFSGLAQAEKDKDR
jgi:hypothetical protein